MVFMLLFGIGFAVLVGNALSENDAPFTMSAVFYLFMAGWLATILCMLVYHARNLGRAKGLPLLEIETEPESSDMAPRMDPARKLRDLEQLRKDGLVSQEEYTRKRHEILDEKW